MRKAKTYPMGKMMDEVLANASRNLVTRQTGKVIRETIEVRLEAEEEGTIVAMDFRDIGIIDYSCADEVIAKLVTRLLSGDYGDTYLFLTSLTPTQKENIHVALERKRSAVLSLDEGPSWQVLGMLNRYLRETLNQVMDTGRISARELADLIGVGINTSGTRLLNLWRLRLICRTEEPLPERGRQYIYWSLLPRGTDSTKERLDP